MNYYASDNIGEVCCLGKHVFRGYLHDEAKTKEAIDSEGWLHTGDIGIWTDVSTALVRRQRVRMTLSATWFN